MDRDPDTRANETTRAGYTYWVSGEQLAHYATLTTLERLKWLDQARQFVLLAETEETAGRRARLRNERARDASRLV